MFDGNTHKALSSCFNDLFIFILYVCIFTIHKGRLEEKAEYPGAARCECWDPKSGLLEEYCTLFTPELFLWPFCLIFQDIM